METGRRRAFVAERPAAFGRQIGIAAFRQCVGLASQGNGDLSLNHEQHAFRTFIQFGAIAAATRLNFHDVLREGFGEAGEWARNHPEPRLVPEGQEACHDIAERAFGDHRIGFGEWHDR